MRKERFAEDNFYHIYSRGVDKRHVFLNDSDRVRFINSLYIFNSFQDIPPRFNVFTLEPRDFLTPTDSRVDIHAACLMPSHYHLMVSQKREGGISALLHKIGTSYTKYFNRKYDRTGRLFESTFKAKLVDREEYASYLTQYIHLNPAELFQAKLGTEEGFEKVAKYAWSSLPDYTGRRSRISLILSGQLMQNVLEINPEQYLESVRKLYNELYQA